MAHRDRTFEESLVDGILFLCLMDRVSELGYVGDRIKVQKVTFLATHEMWHGKYKGFNLTFFRYTWGPFSKHLCDTWDQLKAPGAEYLTEDEVFEVSPKGHRLVRLFRDEVLSRQVNRSLLRVIDAVASENATKAGYIVQEEVYAKRITPVGSTREMTVKEVPMHTDLTRALDSSEAAGQLVIDPGWLDTLAIAFNPEAAASLQRAEMDLIEGRFRVESSG